jgi:hypothetical protein
LALVVSSGCLFADPGLAGPPTRIARPSLGGIDPRPVILSTTNAAGQLQASCAGFQGGPFQMEYTTNLVSGHWIKVGPKFTNNNFTVTLTNLDQVAIYRLGGPNPSYAGATVGGLACGQCHSSANEGTEPWDIWYDYWSQTPHARAFKTLTNANPANATNASCLPCHTVAYGYPGGYTPGNSALEGVQCESCHGPGGIRHRADRNKQPQVQWTSMICGGCHSVSSYPTYQEWKSSGHATMNPTLASSFLDPTNGLSSMFRCGSCHSGAMRAYLMVPRDNSRPDGVEAGREGVLCVGCHDPHANTPNGHQLRNPVFSTAPYSVAPPTNLNHFVQQYQSGINLCGQCHNARGAKWTDTSEPPHASPQYNMLLGSIGELASGTPPNQPASHGLRITNQCVGCHMPRQPHEGATGEGNTGHAFRVASYQSCLPCHPFPEMLVDFTVSAVSNQLRQVKASLDLWGNTKSPEPLRSKYGARAWEYTLPGALSNPPGATNAGPDAAEQALIPANILKARFNLYLILQDGSLGVHNAPHTSNLIEMSRNWIQTELNK